MNHSLAQISTIAENILRDVGVRVKKEIQNPSNYRITHKGATDLVTDIDLWVESEIVSAINKFFPDHNILAEEAASSAGNSTSETALLDLISEGTWWIIDPIDGTTNFANQIPHVGISAGLIIDGKRSVGVIYDPIRDEMFSATLGCGAILNGDKIQTSKKTKVSDSVIATGFPYDRAGSFWQNCSAVYEHFFTRARAIRRYGAATLDQCWVACGRFDAFFEFGLKPWDVAAGSLIIEEAGGCAGNLIRSSSSVSTEFSIVSDSFIFAGKQLFPEMAESGNA